MENSFPELMQQLALAGSWQKTGASWVNSWKLFWPSLFKSISAPSFYPVLKWIFPFAGFLISVAKRHRGHTFKCSVGAETIWVLQKFSGLCCHYTKIPQRKQLLLIFLFPTIQQLHSGNKILFQVLFLVADRICELRFRAGVNGFPQMPVLIYFDYFSIDYHCTEILIFLCHFSLWTFAGYKFGHRYVSFNVK